MDYETDDFKVEIGDIVEIEDIGEKLADLYVRNGVAVFVDNPIKEVMTQEKLDELVKDGLKKQDAETLEQIAEFLGLEYQNKKQALKEITDFLEDK